MNIEFLKYPVGRFKFNPEISIAQYIKVIEEVPERMNALLINAEESKLKWRYRPGGWRLYILIHHIADSHMNAYIRMKKAMTESGDSIAPYDEKAWAALDENYVNVDDSIQIIFYLHRKWVTFLRQLKANDLQKSYYHPSDNNHVSLQEAIQMYAWHSNHHIAHIKQGLDSEGKFGSDE